MDLGDLITMAASPMGRKPRLVPQATATPWYLRPEHPRSERWFAAEDFVDLADPTHRDASIPDTRASLERAVALTDQAEAFAGSGEDDDALRAATLHLHASELRREAGAWSACGENYVALIRHHAKNKEMKRAIAYVRKLLFVTQGASSPSDRLGACLIAASVYVDARQVETARNLAVEAAGIAARIPDAAGFEEAEGLLARIRELSAARRTVKDGNACACHGKGKGPAYQDCCGSADRAPAEFQVRFVGHARRPGRPSPEGLSGQAGIDLLMEMPGPEGECQNWIGVMVEDACHSFVTLPNWSGRALRTAGVMSKRSLMDPHGTEFPSATVLQVACGVEAFINSVDHFIGRTAPERWDRIASTTTGSKDGDGSEQNGSTHRRWAATGTALFGHDWAKGMRLDDLAKLIALRNALMHFQGSHEELIAPAAAKGQALLQRFEGCFEFRSSPRPWIDRILTPALAIWAYDLGDGLISTFRKSWHRQGTVLELAATRLNQEEAMIDPRDSRSAGHPVP